MLGDIVEHLSAVAICVDAGRRLQGLAGAQRFDLPPQVIEFRLPGHVLETGSKLGRHAAHVGDESADPTHEDGQVFWTDHDQGDHPDDEEVQNSTFREHGEPLTGDRARGK